MAKKIVVKKSSSKTDAAAPANVPTAKANVTKVVTPTPVASTKDAKVETVKGPGIHTGVTSGMRVMAYQDRTMRDNLKAKLTDEQLLADWRREFPNTRGSWVTNDAMGLRVVAIVRELFNARRHGAQTIFSDTPIPRYNDKGQVIPETPKRTRKAKVEPTPVVVPEPAATTKVRKVKKAA